MPLDLSILGNVTRNLDPYRAGQEMADRFVGLADAGLNAWRTDKARRLIDDYRRWSTVQDADRFDMDAEIAKRMGDYNVDDDAEKRYQAAFENYQQGAPVVPEIPEGLTKETPQEWHNIVTGESGSAWADAVAKRDAAQKARDAYLAAWDEKKTRDIVSKQAQAELAKRMAQAKADAESAYNGLFADENARAEYEEARKRWTPWTGTGADRRAKFDDERLYELAEAVRWYRPDLAADLEKRAEASANRRNQLDLVKARNFSPLAIMERAQSAYNAASVRLREAWERLQQDPENAVLQEEYNRAAARAQQAGTAWENASNAYFGGNGAQGGANENPADAVVVQQRLLSEFTPRVGEYETLDALLKDAQAAGLNKKGLDGLRTIWNQRVQERQNDARIRIAEANAANATRNTNLNEKKYADATKGTDAAGAYSPANVSKAESILANLEAGADPKPYAEDLKRLGFRMEIQRIGGNLILVHAGKDISANSNAEIAKWLRDTYLPTARKAQGSAPGASGSSSTSPNSPNASGKPVTGQTADEALGF